MSLVTSADLDKCGNFIDKVRGERFNRVKERKISKFYILYSKNIQGQSNNRVRIDNRPNQGVNTDRSGLRNHSRDNNNQSEAALDNSKWVINLSKTSLTKAQESVLAKGPNYAITPTHIPNVDYITTIESVHPKLKEEEAMELRADVNSLLRKAKVLKVNLTKQDWIGLSQLKKDKERVILTADKGVAMVIMDREDYNNKAQELLNSPAYRSLPRDPTNKIKAQLITKFRKIKKERNLDEATYRAMYPTSCVLPKFYGLPKIHKTGNPLRPIVSSRGSVTYGVAKVISKVCKLLVDKSPNHKQSTSDFVSKAKGLTLLHGECLSSYDVTSLFTSVPIDPALNIIRDLLEKDDKLNDRMALSVQNIIELLGFCLHNTYFCFQNKFYEQIESAAVGSPVSLIVAN